MSLTPNGNIRYQLKTPYRGGTTHVIFEPHDFIACVEDPLVIRKMLAHLGKQDTPPATGVLPEGRALPVGRFN